VTPARLVGGALALVLLAGCGSSGSATDGKDVLEAVTSSHPLEHLASVVAGDRASVSDLLALPTPTATTPRPPPPQLADVVDADGLVQLSGRQPAVDAARYADDENDPHFRLAPLRTGSSCA